MSNPRDLILLYDGAIRANSIGCFIRAGVSFEIVRPGYDAQGRRRISWTQFVWEGVPVFEVKKRAELSDAMDHFDAMWDEHIYDKKAGKDDADLLMRALNATKNERMSKFRDGRTGESPAPALSVDGRGEGKRYPA